MVGVGAGRGRKSAKMQAEMWAGQEIRKVWWNVEGDRMLSEPTEVGQREAGGLEAEPPGGPSWVWPCFPAQSHCDDLW